MIKSIHIKNFQAHADTQIEFSPRLTVFVGMSDNGKSTIFRALSKVARNIPEGDFVRTGQRELEIIVETDSGTVTRKVNPKQGAPGNKYIVNGVEFAGFGKAIPQEVLPVVEMSPPLQFGDVTLDLNFGKQHGGLFLIDDTGSTRGKVLGKISGIDVVGRKRQIVANRYIQCGQATKTLEQNETELVAKLQRYISVDLWVAFVEETKIRIAKITEQKTKSEKLSVLVSKYNELTASFETISQQVQDLNTWVGKLDITKLSNLTTLLSKISSVHARYSNLQNELKQVNFEPFEVPTIDSLTQLSYKLSTLNSIYSRWVSLSQQVREVPQITLPDIKLLEDKQQLISKLANIYSRYIQYTQAISVYDAQILQENTELKQTETEFEALKKQLGVCPTCGKTF